jgi:hypothetical protein
VRDARKLTTKDLRNWNLLKGFGAALSEVAAKNQFHPSFSDPRRTLGYASYLSLFLFGLFNPAVQSMRQLCAITELERVRKTTGAPKVSLGSFSEAQALIDPDLLKQVFEKLVEQAPAGALADPHLDHLELIAQDGSLWSALPRMSWAEYGVGPKGEAKGVRLHLRFNILKDCPSDALLTEGKGSETEALRAMLLPGQTTVGDRLYGKSYKLFEEVARAGAFFVFRLHDCAVIHVEEDLPLSAAEQKAGVIRHAWVHLGATAQLRSMRLRLVEVRKRDHRLLLVTNHSVEKLPADLVSAVYRRRWSIELYFRWIKCILGARHFFAESSEGVAIQMYLALIASVLVQLVTGQRPNQRAMDFIHFYFSGWATAEEAARLILKYSAKAKVVKKQ